MWLAVAAAIIASVGVAFLLEYVNASIENESIAKLGRIPFYVCYCWFFIIRCVLVSKSMASKDAVEKLASEAAKSSSKWSIFILVFFAILTRRL